MTNLPPAAVLIAGAMVLPLLPSRIRGVFFLLPPALALLLLLRLSPEAGLHVDFLSRELSLLKVDRLSLLFGTIFTIITFIGGVFGLHMKERRQQAAALLYAAGAVGVVFAGDYLTLYIFWELMAVASVVLIWSRGTEEAARAGMRYLLVHLAGGIVLLGGILLHAAGGGSLEIGPLAPGRNGTAPWLILAGFALNAAIPPLHAWLTDAYPKGTVTGSVFLSALTTKTAVYVLIRVFPGWEILVWAGTIMALYGVVYAVLANDIREILAYHIVSQVGYMVAGVGMGTEMSLNGAAAHAFCHILYKALLFMGAGVVLHTTGKSKLTELGGLAGRMRLTLALYMVGAVSISGFPLFNGFISKSMIISASGEGHLSVVYLLLTLASVGTFLHTGLKLPYFTWYGPDRRIVPSAPPKNMTAAMALAAAGCILLGTAPHLLYGRLPYPVDYHPYTTAHVVETLQLLLFTGIAFFFFIPRLGGEATISLDTDWFYRRPGRFARRVLVDGVRDLFEEVERLAVGAASSLARRSVNPVAFFARAWGRTVPGDMPYDPHIQRPPIQIAISLTLLFAVILSLWATLR